MSILEVEYERCAAPYAHQVHVGPPPPAPGMTYEQYLLAKIAEEAIEFAQMALKCQYFGLGHVYAINGVAETNLSRLIAEHTDLMASIMELKTHTGVDLPVSGAAVQEKRLKLKHWAHVAQTLGRVEVRGVYPLD